MTESPASTETAEPQPVEAPDSEAPAAPTVRRRPARKPSKPDAVLAAAVDTARNAVLEIAGDTPVGEHLGAFPEAERLVTHRFAANVPGYVGWHWFATLARVPRGKDVTVSEIGLLPSGDALLAPDWVPWSERVRPEDTVEETGDPAPAFEDGAEPEGSADAADADAAGTDDPAEDDSVEASAPEQLDPIDPSSPGGESPVA